MKLYFYKFLRKFIKILFEVDLFIRNVLNKISFFLKKKFKVYIVAYKIRKKNRLEFFRFLYINYYFFYKKRMLIQNEFLLLKESDLIKYTNQAISLTFNFYSFNFKFIYFWHCYIKKVPYIS